MDRRRVVVTGIGSVTALGCGHQQTWEGLLEGRSGIDTVASFDPSDFTSQIAGEARDFNPLDHFAKPEARKMDRYTQFALYSADLAVQDAGIDFEKVNRERVGCILGTGIGGIMEMESQKEILDSRGPSRVSPFLIPKMMPNAMSGVISIKYGLQGTNFVTGSACASSAHAIGMAIRSILYNESDVVVTGGSEAGVTKLSMAGFCSLKALSTRNDAPQKASRPFDKDRDGFILGEGGATLILEEYEHARKRDAKIYAELKGYAATADAHHITAPKEDGEGPARAIRIALTEAGLNPSDIDYVNAHGTSTYYNDIIETTALHKAFGEHAQKLAISSSKSMIGHLLGGAAAVECMVTVLSIKHQVAHQTLNHEVPDPGCDLDYIPGEAREMSIKNAISNSLGFGGHNACLVASAV